MSLHGDGCNVSNLSKKTCPLFAGLELLQLLLQWPALLLPTANALCTLLNDHLGAAARQRAVQPACRAALYATVAVSIGAFGLPAVQTLCKGVSRCAWSEFSGQDAGFSSGSEKAPASQRVRGKKRGRKSGELLQDVDAVPPHIAAAQHSQRPAAIADHAHAQVWPSAAPLCTMTACVAQVKNLCPAARLM